MVEAEGSQTMPNPHKLYNVFAADLRAGPLLGRR